MSTKCMEGVVEDSHSQVFNHWSNRDKLAPSLPTAAFLHSLLLMLHAGQQYQMGLSCQRPIDGYHPSSLPSALLAPSIDLVWRWGVTHNSLDHAPCVMLIGLTRSKQVSATVKLCLWGGDCKAKCLRSFSHAESSRVSFRFTPKVSDLDLVVVITEESDFYTRYCRNKLYDSK